MLSTKYEKNVISKFFSFLAGVVDTVDKHSFALIYEKNLMSKISCQTFFNHTLISSWRE